MEYEEKFERIKGLREKYPKLNLIEKGGPLIDLIFTWGKEDKAYDEYFEELDKILEGEMKDFDMRI
jgi:hypothetical protein